MDSRMTDHAVRAQTLLRLCLFTYGPFVGPAVALYFLTLHSGGVNADAKS